MENIKKTALIRRFFDSPANWDEKFLGVIRGEGG